MKIGKFEVSLENHLRLACVFLFFTLLLNTARAAFLPSDRAIDWSQVGVPGGVSTWPASVTLSNLDSTGATDVSATINNAVFAAKPGTAVLLPAGTFLINNQLNMQNWVVLRGQGASTIIKSSSSLGTMVSFTGARWYDSVSNILSGYTQGSSNLVFATIPTDAKVGMQVQIQQNNDPSLVNPAGIDGSAGDWAVGQWVEITAVSGNTLTVWPPLYYNYTGAFTPRIRYPVNGGNANFNFLGHAGLENLVLSNSNPSATANISMQYAAYCWVKNVTSLSAGVCHVWPFSTYRCEVRDSTFLGVMAPITSSRGYGLQTGTPNGGLPSDKTTAMLIENNIWALCRGSIVLGYGASGCVIGYNYFVNTTNETPATLKMDVSIHSAHPYMNLFEGNVGTKINADDFHGSSSHNTIFRNYWRGRPTDGIAVASLTSIECDAWQRYYSIAGNVLGYSNVIANMALLANPLGNALAEVVAPATNWSYGNTYKALMFGYAGEGGGTTGYDTNVVGTVLLMSNFDYVQNATTSNTNVTQSLPPSLYLAGPPSWWPNTPQTPWPPIGPDLSPMVNMIPAQARYATSSSTRPPVPLNFHVLVNSTNH